MQKEIEDIQNEEITLDSVIKDYPKRWKIHHSLLNKVGSGGIVYPDGPDDGIYRYQSFGYTIMDTRAILRAEF